MWALYHPDKKLVVWCGRFRPKRRKGIIAKRPYFNWYDCNGKGPIEGSMNAKLTKKADVLISADKKTKKKYQHKDPCEFQICRRCDTVCVKETANKVNPAVPAGLAVSVTTCQLE